MKLITATALLILLSGADVRAKNVSSRTASPALQKTWKLLFVRRSEDRRHDIWICNGDGAGQRLLIKNGYAPCWSPHRRQIAFMRRRNVWVATADGKNRRQMTFQQSLAQDSDDCHIGEGVSWDAKASRITYSVLEKYRVSLTGQRKSRVLLGDAIFDVSLKPSQRGQLRAHFDLFDTESFCHFSRNSSPAWSLSGRYLAFVRNGDIWIARRRSGLTERAARNRPGGPAWTWEWDVTRLAATGRFDAPTDRMSRQNYAVTKVTWSPDEQHLAYGIQRLAGSGFSEVHVLELIREDSSVTRLAVSKDRKLADGTNPCFSPDGKRVAYCGECSAGGLRDICITTVDGKKSRMLIPDGDEPAW